VKERIGSLLSISTALGPAGPIYLENPGLRLALVLLALFEPTTKQTIQNGILGDIDPKRYGVRLFPARCGAIVSEA
jgi:hypothetical protein